MLGVMHTPMSAMGHEQTFCDARAMPALPPKADIRQRIEVCFVPIADVSVVWTVGYDLSALVMPSSTCRAELSLARGK